MDANTRDLCSKNQVMPKRHRHSDVSKCKITEERVPKPETKSELKSFLMLFVTKSHWIHVFDCRTFKSFFFRPDLYFYFYIPSHYPGAMFNWSQVNDSTAWAANVTCPEFQAFAGLKSNYQKVHSVGCSWQTGSTWVGLPNDTLPQECKPFHWCYPAATSSAPDLNLVLESGTGFTWIGDVATILPTDGANKTYICGANGTWEEQPYSTSTAAQESSTTSQTSTASRPLEPLVNTTTVSTTQETPFKLVISTTVPTEPSTTGLSIENCV